LHKSQRTKQAKRFQADYELLSETVVILDKLVGTAAQKTDLTTLSELLSRIKQAERRFPELPPGTVVATIDAYRKTTLPDGQRSAEPLRLDRRLRMVGEVGLDVVAGGGAAHFDLPRTKSAGAVRWREESILRELEPSEGALIGQPLISLMAGDEGSQASSQLRLKALAGSCERPQVVGTGQQRQELEDLATVVTRNV
jgi:hypothetical protein